MSPREKFSEEELDMLTDEERAGLEEDVETEENDDDEDESLAAADDTAGKKPAEKEAADAEEAGGGDDDDDVEDDPDGKEPAAVETTTADLDVEADTDPAPVAKNQFPDWKAPADAKDRIAEIESKKDELAAKFDDGELTAREYREQLKPLDGAQREIENTVFKATLSYDAAVKSWSKSTVPDFLEQNPQYAPGTLLYRLLDEQVRHLQKETDNPFDPDILAKAHATIAAELGVATTKKPATKKAGEKTDKRELPPSLANVPAADISETDDGGEFAYLDRLADKGGVAFENALAKLSDEKRELYLAQ